jgi:DNA invertase Pin-like site-specific DNA recombinase
MPTSVFSCLLHGLEGRPVEVQVDISPGVPGFFLVGLAATSVRESRERVRAAIRNSDLAFPKRRLTVNLAPAEMRKEGSSLDLAIGVAISLAAAGQAGPRAAAFLGELALDGEVRHVDGVLVAVRALRAHGFEEVFVPPADAAEAALVDGIRVRAGPTLAAVVRHLMGVEPLYQHESSRPEPEAAAEPSGDDLAEVHGQAEARRALEVAASGGHHLLLNGPPGSGKTMMARCLPGLLPPLTLEEALEVAEVRSVIGDLAGRRPLEWRRPFRAPHHSISLAGLVGGGSGLAAPGEISRAQSSVTVCYMSTDQVRAAIYTRISRDEDETRLGVLRQQEDLQREAERRGAEVVLSLEDNDLSGSGKVHRPDYERLIEAIERHEVGLVLAHDLDRLNRGLTDYVRFYTACEKARIKVAWLGGEADFATGTGIFEMDLRASFAREELRKMRSRTRRKHLELATDGKDAGGGRPFGYEEDRHAVRPTEAGLVREAAARVLAGGSLRGLCRDWDQRGIGTVNNARWSAPTMRRMLVSARISGRRERRTIDGKRRDIGTIVAPAVWAAIISPQESDDLRSLLGNGERRMNGHSTKYLLTAGLAVCGLCGAPLVARPRVGSRSMVCAKGPGFRGCGGIRVQADPLEALVSEAVLAAVDGGALAAAMETTEDREAMEGLAGVEQKLADLARDWAADRVSRGEWDAARAALMVRRDALSRRLEASRRGQRLDGLPDPLRASWLGLELHRKRAVIAALVEAVVIGPGVRGRNTFDSDRISIRWKT